jgi:cyclic beta-1,2-glucan synthetase
MLMKSPRSKISLARASVRRQRARELPLRAELFGIEQLARHARLVAARHTIVTGRASTWLLTRLDQNEKVLRAFNRATLAVDQSRRVTPAAEWLLDNFYLIEE